MICSVYLTVAIYLIQELLFYYHIKGRPVKLLELFLKHLICECWAGQGLNLNFAYFVLFYNVL